MNLFVRIFLFFWLTAALLAGSFFLLGRLSGDEAIERAKEVLLAQADIVATLWQQDGRRATRRWLFQQPDERSLLLLDSNAQSPFPKHAKQHIKNQHGSLSIPLKAGIQRHKFGLISIIAALPDTQPPLFLVKQLERKEMHRLPMWVWLAAALLIISLVSYLLAKILSQRIRQLRYAVQGVTEGDLSARVTLGGNDEVTELATDFNMMAERIQNMITSQRQLVSDVSHELRSPLARLRVALELAQRSGESGCSLTRIEKEADELEHLVTELLSLARLESGQSQLEKQAVDMNALLEKITQDALYEGAETHKEVSFSAVEPISLIVDPVLISAAIENVVRNALRHTPPDSSVKIHTQISNDFFNIIIDDQGPGVPEASLGQLFEPFARVAAARDRDSGGFGLGLAITGRTMHAHGGTVVAENRSQGGLRVILKLPL